MKHQDLPSHLAVFDTETTGVDVENDRILTCYYMLQNRDGEVIEEREWVIDPGIEVPEGAAAVHGMSTKWIRANGRKDAGKAVGEIYAALASAATSKFPIVAFNARFDASILHHELLRHGNDLGITPLLAPGVTWYDPFVHDKGREKYRRGPRKLQFVCQAHGIEFNESEAHAARYDVVKTGELAWKLLAKERKLGASELMPLLVEWKQEQDSSLEAYFRREGKTNEDGSPIIIDRGWPLITKKGN